MIEHVIELRPQFEELCFPNVNSLQEVTVPVILTRSPQRIAAESTAPSAAREQSDVLRVRGIDTCAPSIRIRVEGRANRHATWIDRRRSDCRHGTNSSLTIRVEVRSSEIANARVCNLATRDCERHTGFKRRYT